MMTKTHMQNRSPVWTYRRTMVLDAETLSEWQVAPVKGTVTTGHSLLLNPKPTIIDLDLWLLND